MKYIPVGERMELNLGMDSEVLLERKLMDYKILRLRFDRWNNVDGYDTEVYYLTKVKNTKKKPIRLEVERTFSGDWEILQSELKSQEIDINTIRFVLELKPSQETTYNYMINTRCGKNARR